MKNIDTFLTNIDIINSKIIEDEQNIAGLRSSRTHIVKLLFKELGLDIGTVYYDGTYRFIIAGFHDGCNGLVLEARLCKKGNQMPAPSSMYTQHFKWEHVLEQWQLQKDDQEKIFRRC